MPVQPHQRRDATAVLPCRAFAAWAIAVHLLCSLAVPGGAHAHAVLLDSRPPQGAALQQSPPTVTLRFNAKLEKSVTHVTLTSIQNVPIPVKLVPDTPVDQVVIRMPDLAAGVYLLGYKVLARDGHLTEGTLRFTVLAP